MWHSECLDVYVAAFFIPLELTSDILLKWRLDLALICHRSASCYGVSVQSTGTHIRGWCAALNLFKLILLDLRVHLTLNALEQVDIQVTLWFWRLRLLHLPLKVLIHFFL